jgi:hypothetical protein
MNKKILCTFLVLFPAILLALGLSYIRWHDDLTAEGYLTGTTGHVTLQTAPSWKTNQTDAPLWNAAANMPAPTRYHGAGVGYSRNDTNWLFCFGGDATGTGQVSNVTSIYNARTNIWSTGAIMPNPRFYICAALLGNSVYLIGGIPTGPDPPIVPIVSKYDIMNNTWSLAQFYPNDIADADAAGYQDSLIYVAGGLLNTISYNATANVNLYNRFTNSWRPATPLPAPRSGGAMAITGDTIVYVCGGPGYNTGLTNTVFRGLISQSNRSVITWITGANYPGTSRHRMDAAPWGCKGIITGPGSGPGFTTTNECYVYSPGNNVWTQMPNKPTPTSALFLGSARSGNGIWRLICASGLVLTPPYSIPQTEILSDTFCPTVNCTYKFTQVDNNGFTKPILNVATTRDTINVTAIGLVCTICDVNVRIDTVLHTWDSDIAFTITHGTVSVELITHRGGSGDNFIGTILNDSALLPISSGTAPFTGSFRPESPLIPFNGLVPGGLWVLTIVDDVGGDSGYLKQWALVISFTCPVGGIQTIEVPFTYRLSQNYPNPFNPTTTIKYGLPKPGNTKLVVYDILGRVVTTLVNEYKTAGTYSVNFDGTNYSSGIYFYSLESGNYKETKKMLIVK